jgi:predicted TIM-barrel fold metal-dependent hydrolase
MDFTRISKVTLPFEMRFCRQAPGKIMELKNMPSLCVLDHRKIPNLAISPLGRWPARAVRFQRAPAAGSAGNGRGVVQGFPRFGLGV